MSETADEAATYHNLRDLYKITSALARRLYRGLVRLLERKIISSTQEAIRDRRQNILKMCIQVIVESVEHEDVDILGRWETLDITKKEFSRDEIRDCH